MISKKQKLRELQKRVQKFTKGKSLVEELKALRQEEYNIEQRKLYLIFKII